MKNLNNSNSLSELLAQLKDLATPILVSLSSRKGSNNYLMDQIVAKVQKGNQIKIAYKKLNPVLSQTLKQELMLTKNPVLLLIQRGEIKAIFSGMVPQFQLEEALQNLNTQYQ